MGGVIFYDFSNGIRRHKFFVALFPKWIFDRFHCRFLPCWPFFAEILVSIALAQFPRTSFHLGFLHRKRHLFKQLAPVVGVRPISQAQHRFKCMLRGVYVAHIFAIVQSFSNFTVQLSYILNCVHIFLSPSLRILEHSILSINFFFVFVSSFLNSDR